MPRIPDAHLESVVFVYPSRDAATRGERVGGSGFVIDYGSGIGDWRIRYAVTNAHVVEQGGHWVRLNRVGFRGLHIAAIPPENWDSSGSRG